MVPGRGSLGWGRAERGDGRRSRGAVPCGLGAWRARAAPGWSGLGQYQGLRGGFGLGRDAWSARWHRHRRTDAAVGKVQGGGR